MALWLVLWVDMGKKYRHISLEERDRIAEMKSLGQTVTEIAEALGRSKSTLSRELRRNSTPAYKVQKRQGVRSTYLA
ncbi:MAG: helix-turn-helix domain-containing protein [Thermodesulfobacteriota bacterium]|nr:helix-turn-helix domain-containing protein [Thermodesulfobacteriota bacterium]